MKLKQTKETTVVLHMTLSQAERIETAFARIGPIALASRTVVNEGYRMHAQAKEKGDSALIPVRVRLTLDEAKMVVNTFARWLDAPADRDIYVLVKKAIDGSAS